MIRRRRRPNREVAFSFDSFLDVVANVVGIILRLILVAWIGARSYKAVVDLPKLPSLPPLSQPTILPEPTDDQAPIIARKKREIGAQEKALVGELARREQLRSVATQLRKDIQLLATRCAQVSAEEKSADQEKESQIKVVHSLTLSEEELKKRAQELLDEADKIKNAPPKRQELKYLCPISATLTHEVMFECKAGRVTLIDYAALHDLYKRDVKTQAEQLRTQWVITPTTESIGAFRLRYRLERERSFLDGPSGAPPLEGSFRYARSYAEVEPITPQRGEPLERALSEGSEFRKVIDSLDARKIGVTLWVYPDSFPLYRGLRDHLHAKNLVVAGRPLEEGNPIAFGVNGTKSRGQ